MPREQYWRYNHQTEKWEWHESKVRITEGPANSNKKSLAAVLSVWFGGAALIGAVGFFPIGWVLGSLALLLGFIGLDQAGPGRPYEGRRLAKLGLWFGSIALAISIIIGALIIAST